MNLIITQKGEYLSNSFTGKNGTWDLVGTAAPDNDRDNATKCKDHFVNKITNERLTV